MEISMKGIKFAHYIGSCENTINEYLNNINTGSIVFIYSHIYAV